MIDWLELYPKPTPQGDDCPTMYLAGPMRGHKQNNFPSFFQCEEQLTKHGYSIINPARLDIEAGFDPDVSEVTLSFLCEAFARDLPQICMADGIFLIEGWAESEGVAKIELPLCQALNKKILCVGSRKPPPPDSVLDEAICITSGDRNGDYGHPADHWLKTTGMINACFGLQLKSEDWGKMMMIDKLSRDQHRPKRDNLTDICGYSRCVERVREKEGATEYAA